MVSMLFVPILCVCISRSWSESLKKQILDGLLTNYDKRILPGIYAKDSEPLGPSNISIKLYISDLYDVDVNEMDFSMTCYLHQIWKDNRLKFDRPDIDLELNQEEIEHLWTPDTYVPETKYESFHQVTKPNALFHIRHDGSVLFSLRLQLKISCTMNFRMYPFDRQTCIIHIESFGHSSRKLIYSWVKTMPVVVKNVNLALYHIDGEPETDSSLCHDGLFQDGTGFSCLKMKLTLQRELGYYIIEIIIPDILIVVLSWASFWLHPLAVPGRVSLGVVTVLTMSSQGSTFREQAPRVSYIKAIDIWSLFQIMFVFAAMLEFSVANVLARMKLSTTRSRSSHLDTGRIFTIRESQGNFEDPDMDERNRPYLETAKKVDRLSRIMFPTLYFVLNVLFWVVVFNIN